MIQHCHHSSLGHCFGSEIALALEISYAVGTLPPAPWPKEKKGYQRHYLTFRYLPCLPGPWTIMIWSVGRTQPRYSTFLLTRNYTNWAKKTKNRITKPSQQHMKCFPSFKSISILNNKTKQIFKKL